MAAVSWRLQKSKPNSWAGWSETLHLWRAGEVPCGTRFKLSRSETPRACTVFLKSSKTFPLHLSWDWKGWCTGTICGFTMNVVPLLQSSLSEGFTGYEKCCFFNSQGQISEQSQRGSPRQGFSLLLGLQKLAGGTPVMLLPTIKMIENYISMGWWKGIVVVQVHFQTTPLPLGRAYLASSQNTLAF